MFSLLKVLNISLWNDKWSIYTGPSEHLVGDVCLHFGLLSVSEQLESFGWRRTVKVTVDPW